MMVSLDFWFAVAYAAVSLAFIFSRAAVSMVVGYGVVVVGDFGTGRTLVARNVGLYAYRAFVHPPFLSDNRQYFLLY